MSHSCLLLPVTRYYEVGPDNFTTQLANAVASGAKSVVGSENVRLLTPTEASFQTDVKVKPNSNTTVTFHCELNSLCPVVQDWADAVIVGTPVYNANVHPVVQSWIDGYVRSQTFRYPLLHHETCSLSLLPNHYRCTAGPCGLI